MFASAIYWSKLAELAIKSGSVYSVAALALRLRPLA